MSKVTIVMGVSGCGKTTVGKLLAKSRDIPFYDADDFHPAANIEKMKNGQPLNDQDRIPWLKALASKIIIWNENGGAVLACSALKESYREILSVETLVDWVYLSGSFETIFERMRMRNHFMKPEMLQSQFDALEIPSYGFHANITDSPEKIVSKITQQNTMKLSEFGIIGLGVMGSSLAKNIAGKGFSLSVYNRMTDAEKDVVSNFLKNIDNSHVSGFTEIKGFVNSMAKPRKILLMVNAGKAVDVVVDSIQPLLDAGDIIIDGGNSHYKDTQRRAKELLANGLHFMGTGISGGEEGALNGPSMMVGASAEQYSLVQPIFEAITAKDIDGLPCAANTGPDGCGHFVKTIHNGIEYAEMQLLAEMYALLAPSLSYNEISTLFKKWNQSELGSYLLEITANILTKKDGEDYLVDKIVDIASSKGTGSWSSQAAFQLGAPASMINSAVTARYVSMLKEKREELTAQISAETSMMPINLDLLQHGYQFARVINHIQGFEIIKAASIENNWNVNLSEIARIWTNGCIIKSALMEQFVFLFKDNNDALRHPQIVMALNKTESSIKEILHIALEQRIAVPCFSDAWQFWIGITTSKSAANMIQAQRDYFGAHTYKRTDQPTDKNFTTNWTQNG